MDTKKLDAMATVREMWSNPEQVVMSHIDRTYFTLEEMLDLADTGCCLEFDLFGQESSYELLSRGAHRHAQRRRPHRLHAGAHGARIREEAPLLPGCLHEAPHHRVRGERYTHIINTVIPAIRRKSAASDDNKPSTKKTTTKSDDLLK